MTYATDDSELVRACREGNIGAFEALLARHERSVFNAAYRLLSNREDAKDITQSVFLKAFEKLASYDPSYRFRSWIYRIAVNESLNLLKRSRRVESLVEERVSPGRNPEELFSGNELSRHVQEALMTLTPDYRTVIVLRHFLGCSYQDIAEIVHVPEKTVKSRIYSARRLLRDALVASRVVR